MDMHVHGKTVNVQRFICLLGSTSSALAKLSKATSSGSLTKQQVEKKETPQERLKRIMSKQLNKQSN